MLSREIAGPVSGQPEVFPGPSGVKVNAFPYCARPWLGAQSFMLVTDIAVYAALFAALGLVFVVHRVLSNYLQKREPRLTSFTK